MDNSNQTMGIANSQEGSSWLLDRYQFIDHLQLQEFGTVAVFRKRQENYDYMALLPRAVRVDYQREIQRELCFLTGKKVSLPFLKIFQVEVGQMDLQDSILAPRPHRAKACWKEPGQEVLNIYMELLTYTLADHLNHKKQGKLEITLKEYAYILKTALSAAMLYEEWRLEYLQLSLTPQSIFLKPNGEIKLLPFRSRYLREANDCECFAADCMAKCEGRGECRTYSFSSPKKKESKYLKQLKNLSLELYSTINPKVDLYVRSIPHFNTSYLLSLQELQALKELQFAIVATKSLREAYQVLKEVEDDFLAVQHEESKAEVEISNPEAYQAFIQHLATLNSFKKQEMSSSKQNKIQQVTRNIFGVEPTGDSDSNTHSNLSPRSQQRASLKGNFDTQPAIAVLPQFSHHQPNYY